MAGIRRDLQRRLDRAEIVATATKWADRQAAHHRRALRASVKFHILIRERLQAMGIDPALAMRLRSGDEAAAELAAIPDTDELRTSDEAITRDDLGDCEEGRRRFIALIEKMATQYRHGRQPDFATASSAELFAFCVAAERTSGQTTSLEEPR